MKKLILIIPFIVASCGLRDFDLDIKNGIVYGVEVKKLITTKRCWCYVKFENNKIGIPCDESTQVGDSVKIIFKRK